MYKKISHSIVYVYIVLFFISTSKGFTASIKRTSRTFAEKTVSYQIDGYKHLAYIPVFSHYCESLLKELKAKHGASKKVRILLKEIKAIDKSTLVGKNPFHVLEEIILASDSASGDGPRRKALRKLQNDRWHNLKLSGIPACEFDENTLAKTQVCYHHFPAGKKRDAGKEDCILISIGGRRTGMTKVLPLGREIQTILQRHFNLYSCTVEAKMLTRDEEFIPWRIANTLKAVIDTLHAMNPETKPRIILGGYSYGGSHLIRAINLIFTRASFEQYKPDLLLFVDPDGALNTLKHLHLVPAADRIINFRGIYIVPQPKLRFIRKLLASKLDEYPSLEGTQPLVLLQKANFQEIIIYQSNQLDLSPHNRVPFDIVDYRDENGIAVYMDIIKKELKNLADIKKQE